MDKANDRTNTSVSDRGRLIVLNKDEDSVSFISCDSGETFKKLDVDRDPHEVIVTKDGKISYVANAVGKTVAVIDNDAMAVVETISHPDFDFPHGLDLNADGSSLTLLS